jgi:polyisoprenoid-binding protein YceI
MMRNRFAAAAIALVLATPAVAWAPALATRLSPQPASKLWVEGTSSVRSYKCEATKINGGLDLQGEMPATVAELQAAVSGVDLTIPVAQLDCGNGTMNDHMRKALKTDANPMIKFNLTKHEVAANGAVTMTGKLSIAGQEQPVTLTANATQENGGLRVKGSKQLKMTEFGVKPPSLMMGTMKVGDPVTVHFDLVLK